MKRNRILILSMMLSLLISTSALAQHRQETPISLDAEVTWGSNYTWRGLLLTDGPVLQPTATLSAAGFSFNIWANMDLDEVNDQQYEFNEVDLTGSYSLELSLATVEAGVIYYTFPNTEFESTMELFGSISFNLPFNPNVTLFQDIDLVEGTYVNGGFSQNFFEDQYGQYINLYAQIGWGSSDHNLFYYGVEESGFTDFQAGGLVLISVTESIYLVPSVAWSSFVNEEIRDQFEDTSHYITALAVTVSF